MKIPTCNLPCKTAVVLTIAILVMLTSGCAGSVKTTKPNGTEISTPAAVAVMEAAAAAHETCDQGQDVMAEYAKLNCNDANLKEGGQEECFQTKQMAMFAVALGQKMDPGEGCHAEVASEAKAYFASQASKYNMWGTLGRAGIWGGVTIFGIKSFTGMIDGAISATGDEIITGDINVTKSDDPIGGEGGGADGNIGGQTVTIGSGSVASGDRSAVIDAEKAINFPGDSNMDADGAPAGTTGVTLDDSGDGGGNSIVPGF